MVNKLPSLIFLLAISCKPTLMHIYYPLDYKNPLAVARECFTLTLLTQKLDPKYIYEDDWNSTFNKYRKIVGNHITEQTYPYKRVSADAPVYLWKDYKIYNATSRCSIKDSKPIKDIASLLITNE